MNGHNWTIKHLRRKGEDYLEQLSTMLSEANADSLRELLWDLWDFIALVKKKLGDKRLSPRTRSELQCLDNKLREQALLTAKRIVEREKEAKVIGRMERLALPEPADGVARMDFSGWLMRPLGYSSRLRSKLANRRLPQ